MLARNHCFLGFLFILLHLGTVTSYPVSPAVQCGTIFERRGDLCIGPTARSEVGKLVTDGLSDANEFIRRAGGSGLGLKRPRPDDPEEGGRPSPAPPSEPQGSSFNPLDTDSDETSEESDEPTNQDDNIPQGDPAGLPGAKVLSYGDDAKSGYEIQGPTRAQLKLGDAIANNRADANPPPFDAIIPGRFDTNRPAYFPPTLKQGPQGQWVGMKDTLMRDINPSDTAADQAKQVGIDSQKADELETRFGDPDVQLPTDDTVDPNGASYKGVGISSMTDADPLGALGEEDDHVVDISINREGSVMIIKNMFASHDTNDPQDKLTSSELLFQAAGRGRSGDTPASNLKVVVHKETVNVPARDTLRDIYNKMLGGLNEQKLVLHSDVDTSTTAGQNERDAFDAMSKTPNVETTNFMLADHHQALGNLEIKKIVLFPDDVTPDRAGFLYSASFDMFLFLGPRA